VKTGGICYYYIKKKTTQKKGKSIGKKNTKLPSEVPAIEFSILQSLPSIDQDDTLYNLRKREDSLPKRFDSRCI
jgi:hypothetical protein